MSADPLRSDLPSPGLFAVCGGVTFAVRSSGADDVALVVPDGISVLPEHRAEGTTRDGQRWIRVRKTMLERYFRMHVVVRWQGEDFGLGRVTGDVAEIHGGSPPIAARLGMDGDQYNGFRAAVPVEELTVVVVREQDIDV